MTLAQVMDGAPVDDLREFPAGDIVVVGVAVIVRPAAATALTLRNTSYSGACG